MDTKNNPAGTAFDVTHRLVLSIAIPMTLGFITTPLLGLVGTGVVGHMGRPDALAGLAIGAMLFDLILGSFNFLRASTTGLTAQAYGRHDRRAQQGSSGGRSSPRSVAGCCCSVCPRCCWQRG
jgi:MATE family multidrug resistance protein